MERAARSRPADTLTRSVSEEALPQSRFGSGRVDNAGRFRWLGYWTNFREVDAMSKGFPLIKACGSPRELGRQHGEPCRGRMLAFLDYLQSTLRLSRVQLHARAMRFLPLFEQYCSHLVEEVRGLAEGAD